MSRPPHRTLRPRRVLPLLMVLAAAAPSQDAFGHYWYRGEAEIARYDLEQSRYGEVRDGHAVLVFVTEPFSRERQLKVQPSASSETTTVLKLNHLQRFTTGIYDYSLMRSVFTPLHAGREPPSLKVTASVQEWCGHVWLQLNREGERWRVTGHSYFASEGEESRTIDAAPLEDGVWTRIRIDPSALPQGELHMVPGVFDSRLRHRALEPERVRARLVPDEGDESSLRYELRYPGSGRHLTITFEKTFPHGILGWEESWPGRDGSRERTRARRTHVLQSAYWKENAKRFSSRRAELGLPAAPR